MAKPLEKEFQYYLDNQEKLVEQYGGKYIVIKDDDVIGAYDSDEEALTETCKKHKLGTFMVIKCEAGEDSYTQVYHSRVAFA